MGLFGRLFGSKDDLPALRKAIAQHRFADARLIAEELAVEDLNAEERREFETLRCEAGDRLARLNLEEGLGLQRSGDRPGALEHLQLARQQALSSELLREVTRALKTLDSEPTAPLPGKKAAGSSCGGCGPVATAEPPAPHDDDLPDFASRIELILASYPPALAERYRSKSPQFQEAFLSAHEEDETTALKRFQKVPTGEKDDLFDFEVGSLLGRQDRIPEAMKYLKAALDKNPEHLLAAETLIMFQVARKQGGQALARLEEMLKKGQDPAFCHAQLATIRLQMKDRAAALEHARQALALGHNDPQTMLMAAALFEQEGDLKAAEKLYGALPAGGCGGGANVHLAEFWLRHNKHLAKVLDSFNAACRQEPQNPRWQLRVAQTYLARRWDKQGLELLQRVLPDPGLAPELRTEGEALLASKVKA